MKLVRNGNSAQLTVPRPYLHYLGWKLGDNLLLTANEDQSLLVRRIVVTDDKPGPVTLRVTSLPSGAKL
jgi:antitoxin component of MazEF toxin-antitoxin module